MMIRHPLDMFDIPKRFLLLFYFGLLKLVQFALSFVLTHRLSLSHVEKWFGRILKHLVAQSLVGSLVFNSKDLRSLLGAVKLIPSLLVELLSFSNDGRALSFHHSFPYF